MAVKQRIIFRADGNSAIGLGHFFRVLALADLLKEEFDCILAIQEPDEFVRAQIQKTSVGTIELAGFRQQKTTEKQNNQEVPFDLKPFLKGNEIVVLDGYKFGNNYQRSVKETGCVLVYIDDVYHDYPYADAIINHALSASGSMYKNTSARILAGPDYSLMRKEFLEAARIKQIKVRFNTVFVSFGGADSEELAFKISSLLAGFPTIKTIHILNSSSFKGDVEKFRKAASNVGKNICVHQDINAAQIIELMRSSDFGVVSASNTSYECVCTGLPMVIGHYVDHQIQFYKALIRQPNVRGIGRWQAVTGETVLATIEKLISNYDPDEKSFIDGFQQERFIDLFKSFKPAQIVSAI